ncbi:hypothetical protein LTR37_006960 [Vermiconidia calcicola]|uniref:Uncharacterized protein n=1 Tax=Vermiconidia calcicola TaxID=1690605 RepID=A0ACC3NEW3_9PEZI|nr:hypothetical protein LTR37_006960 [Vermiconidia calcicola]
MITRRLARPLSVLSSSGWTCPSCSKASLLPQRLPQIPLQRRKLHHVPPLTYDETFKRDGVPGLFSPTGYQIAWTTYQNLMVQKLNELTAGEPFENKQPKDIVIQFARDPMNASLFNHASMAHNNHYFFSGLSTSPQHIDNCPLLKESLEHTFGSIDTLRATMLDTAAAMFGPGFVWLVWARDVTSPTVRRGEWRILTTYLAGTPYPEAGYRHQGLDMNTSNAATYAAYQAAEPVNTAGKFGPYSKTGKESGMIPPGGVHLMPTLCVNTWEHTYIYDFGLPGKRKYLADWWEAVDWGTVEYNTPREAWQDFDRGMPRRQ